MIMFHVRVVSFPKLFLPQIGLDPSHINIKVENIKVAWSWKQGFVSQLVDCLSLGGMCLAERWWTFIATFAPLYTYLKYCHGNKQCGVEDMPRNRTNNPNANNFCDIMEHICWNFGSGLQILNHICIYLTFWKLAHYTSVFQMWWGLIYNAFAVRHRCLKWSSGQGLEFHNT